CAGVIGLSADDPARRGRGLLHAATQEQGGSLIEQRGGAVGKPRGQSVGERGQALDICRVSGDCCELFGGARIVRCKGGRLSRRLQRCLERTGGGQNPRQLDSAFSIPRGARGEL